MEEKRERESPIGGGERKNEIFCFLSNLPHTTYYNSLITLHPQMSLVYIVCDHNTYFHKPNLSKDYLYFN